ncbi:hypothetical protein MKX01_032963, partial [Papaver californicum]
SSSHFCRAHSSQHISGRKQQPPSSSNSDAAAKRRSYRHKPGTKAFREIRKFQKSTDLLLPAAPFIRIVKEITNNFSKEVSRWKTETLQAFQEKSDMCLNNGAEICLLGLFSY